MTISVKAWFDHCSEKVFCPTLIAMCGILGILPKGDFSSEDLQRSVEAMCDAIPYRGPDDRGEFVTNDIALGHRRLSIIDVTKAGHQPMILPQTQNTLVFNGEIYNHKALAQKYLQGVKLTSTSDTEVLLHLLSKKGLDILPELRGMFAFGFWSDSKKELLLGCDPFGKKPLYYVDTPQGFVFASEPKALLAVSFISATIAIEEHPAYLLHEYIPAPRTAWQGMYQLGMGQAAIVKANSLVITTWWKPTFTPKHTISFEVATKKFDELLGQAVERRMVADVPVGLFLSGGIDSTTILWYMQQIKKSDIHSCSVSFTEETFNETAHIDLAVRALRPTHHDVRFDVPAFHQALVEIIPRLDIPFADASFLPTYIVSKLARTYMTVVLSGDGADEMLGGYGTFQAAEFAEKLKPFSFLGGPAVEKVVGMLPVSHRYFSFDFKLKSFLRGLSYPLARRNQVWLGSFSEQEITRLLKPEHLSLVNDMFKAVDALEVGTDSLSLFDAVSHLTIHHYLHDDILVKLDRATMLHSLEARTPFLDVDVADFLLRLPMDYKKDKRLLKATMRGRIPDAIIDRPKKGFGIPLGKWFMGPLREWLLTTLSRERVEKAGFWQWSQVQRLCNEHIQGKADHRKKLWTLIMWQLWYERWVMGK